MISEGTLQVHNVTAHRRHARWRIGHLKKCTEHGLHFHSETPRGDEFRRKPAPQRAPGHITPRAWWLGHTLSPKAGETATCIRASVCRSIPLNW
mmetsp:Transcript_7772/g.17053  ORF Transcript_7772/g.17053 Transcript_7772/m.17053 type:complete len:94 (+) Transcript_7772:63-344(+)